MIFGVHQRLPGYSVTVNASTQLHIMLLDLGIQLSERNYYRKLQRLGLKRRGAAKSDQEVAAGIQREIQENGNTKGNCS